MPTTADLDGEQFIVLWHASAHAAHGPYAHDEAQALARQIPGAVVVKLSPPPATLDAAGVAYEG